MKSIPACLPLIVTGAVLLATTMLLGSNRLEYCNQPEALRPRTDFVAAVESRLPTLAPPQKVVYLRVEADKLDLEIGWARN
jgi:hypothetical protein